jgi:uncharacterized metal-binding protein YceD (DUF177 family)
MRYRLRKLVYGPVGGAQIEKFDYGPIALHDLNTTYLRGLLEFTRLNDAVLLRGELETETPVQCVRSLETFGLQLRIRLDEILLGLPQYPRNDIEPWRRIGEDGWIDLTETLREEIIMAIPINPIHPKYIAASSDDLLSALDEHDRDWITIHLSNPRQTLEGEADDTV